jgi:hypothetical protein
MKSNFVKLLSLVIIFSIVPLGIVRSEVLAETIHSYPDIIPTIDGAFNEAAWKSELAKNITLYNITNQEDTIEISIMSVYDAINGSIVFALTIPDETMGIDVLMIAFRTNITGDFIQKNPNWGFNTNCDLKIYYASANTSGDGVTDWYIFDGNHDTSVTGTNDVIAKGTYIDNNYNIELFTELDSGDIDGSDFSLSEKDKIDFFIWYRDSSTSTTYSQVRVTDDDFDYCVLVVGKPGLPLYALMLIIIAGTILIILIIILVARKKR